MRRWALPAGFALLSTLLSAQAPPPGTTPVGAPPVVRQSPSVGYSGSLIAPGGVSATPLNISLRDAIARALKYNLGVLNDRDASDVIKAERRRALASLMPSFYIGLEQTSQQVDLVAFGFSAPGFPAVVGPFGYQNVRAYYQQTLYDRQAKINLKSIDESRKAVELGAGETRNLVVQAVSNAYLNVVTENARIASIENEVKIAQSLYDRTADQKKAGTVAGIDVLRADVQLKNEQQRLIAEKNQLEKAKLALAQVIGLPGGQQFTTSDPMPYSPLLPGIDELLPKAYAQRAEIKAAEANVRAAQFALDSAHAETRPTVVVQGDYGDIGSTIAHSHGTYSLVAGVRIPVYAGGRTQTDIDQAEVVLRNRRNALEELRGRIEYQVRNALVDLQFSADRLAVAKTNVDLATQTVNQAKDRLGAGVTDNIETIQAQQLLVQADESYIASLNAHNAAKIALATALGAAEEGAPAYLGAK